MSDRIVVMSQGRIEQMGYAARSFTTGPQTRFVAGFFGDNNLIEGTCSSNGRRLRRRWAVFPCACKRDAGRQQGTAERSGPKSFKTR